LSDTGASLGVNQLENYMRKTLLLLSLAASTLLGGCFFVFILCRLQETRSL
jgi:hypothetical protein